MSEETTMEIKRVLIIDDQELVRLSIDKVLKNSKAFTEYEIKSDLPDSFDASVSQIESRIYSCIICDFNLWEGKTAQDILAVVKFIQPLTGTLIVTADNEDVLLKFGLIDPSTISILSKGEKDFGKKLVKRVKESIKATEIRHDFHKFQRDIEEKADKSLGLAIKSLTVVEGVKLSMDDLSSRFDKLATEDCTFDKFINWFSAAKITVMGGISLFLLGIFVALIHTYHDSKWVSEDEITIVKTASKVKQTKIETNIAEISKTMQFYDFRYDEIQNKDLQHKRSIEKNGEDIRELEKQSAVVKDIVIKNYKLLQDIKDGK